MYELTWENSTAGKRIVHYIDVRYIPALSNSKRDVSSKTLRQRTVSLTGILEVGSRARGKLLGNSRNKGCGKIEGFFAFFAASLQPQYAPGVRRAYSHTKYLLPHTRNLPYLWLFDPVVAMTPTPTPLFSFPFRYA